MTSKDSVITANRDEFELIIKDSGFWLDNELLFEELKQIIDNDRDALVKIMRGSEGEDLKSYIMHTMVLRWLIKCHSFDVVKLR